jgi:hypothetical protein
LCCNPWQYGIIRRNRKFGGIEQGFSDDASVGGHFGFVSFGCIMVHKIEGVELERFDG